MKLLREIFSSKSNQRPQTAQIVEEGKKKTRLMAVFLVRLHKERKNYFAYYVKQLEHTVFLAFNINQFYCLTPCRHTIIHPATSRSSGSYSCAYYPCYLLCFANAFRHEPGAPTRGGGEIIESDPVSLGGGKLILMFQEDYLIDAVVRRAYVMYIRCKLRSWCVGDELVVSWKMEDFSSSFERYKVICT